VTRWPGRLGVDPDPTLKPTLNFGHWEHQAQPVVPTWVQNQLDKGTAMTEHPQDQPQQPSYGQQPGEPMPPYSPQAPQYSAQPSFQPMTMSPADQRTWAIAAHLSPFLAFLVGGLMLLGPLIIYLVFKDRGPFIRHHSAEALNFQLTMWIGLLISIPLMIVLIGFFTFGAILLLMLICHILGAVAAGDGRDFRYPLTIHFVS
jgi:uncharacterized protein